MMNNPSRRTRMRCPRSMVGVSYWKNILSIEFREDMCSQEDITAFVNNLIGDYMHFRHPFMKTVTEDTVVLEIASRHRIAQIMY
jgi:hypothetical protein